ncbi:MAG TPA: methyltransferase domain-containing protein [Mycobacteriales bacterium]|nr:methyltransferase domain-containing protein [Mycobacteriales bacterium]
MIESEASRARWSSLRPAVVGELLSAALTELGPGPLQVVDAGGGTGGFAVPLAAAGHHVTVVDPNPDAMAALRRRVEEYVGARGAGDSGRGTLAGTVTAIQGDLAGLLEAVPPAGADVVLCHHVLELVDDPASALRAVRAALRPGGLASVLVTGRGGTVLARVLAGRLGEAAELLGAVMPAPATVAGEPRPRGGATGGSGPAGYRIDELRDVLAAAGLDITAMHAARVFGDLVPSGVLDGDPDATAALLALERTVATLPEYLPIAAQVHVLARRDAPRAAPR